MKNIVIVDYGMGNIRSLSNALKFLKYNPIVTNNIKLIQNSDILFLPGVGSFAQAMKNIRDNNLEEAIIHAVKERKIPFMGICLGMQLLANNGFEDGLTKGLGLVDGEIIELSDKTCRVPHVGFNEVVHGNSNQIFNGINESADFYFTHSYHFKVNDNSNILCRTNYGNNFISGVIKDNIFGFQFHPEKSQYNGLKLLNNFCSII
jgi:glutamine amidotransferase